MMKKRVWVLLVAAVMVLTMGVNAFAVEVPTVGNGTETQEATVFVTKNLIMAEGITVPNATFQFEITGKTEGAPKASIAPVSYPADTQQATENKLESGLVLHELRQTVAITFEAFPHAGLYEYEVKETADTYQGEGTVTYAADVYHLQVYVANKADGSLYVKTVTAQKEGTKQSQIVFTNYFGKNASLTVEKKTTGDLADKTKSFQFTIKFTEPATSLETEFVGTIDGAEVRCPVGQVVPFNLKDGQKLVFDSLPAGTRYTVTEVGTADGYVPSVTVTENGTVFEAKTGTDGENLTTVRDNPAGNLAGEGTNAVVFENIYNEVPITGVIINNLPFVVLIGVTVLALAALVIFKHRRAARRS